MRAKLLVLCLIYPVLPTIPSVLVFAVLFSLEIEVSLQVSNPTPMEGDVVAVCVAVTVVNASESDLEVVLFAMDGLASE